MTTRRTPVSRRDRPAKPALSRAGVVAVAVRVTREEGLEKVTMRRLATELDTGPASLYVYVANMAELHGAVLDELLGELDLGPDRPLVELLTAVTGLLFRYPSVARSVLTLRPAGPHYLRLIDSALTLLAAEGVPAAQAAWGVDLLLQHAIATAAEHGTRSERADDEPLEEMLRGVSDTDHPAITAAGEHLLSGTGEQRLRWAFTALIAGIAVTAVPPA
ncbi:TetR/AcrR family transcriptional regulator C-terminal domain-containing protein [Actinoplanes sp. NPDC051494]|uniref:TetR/AcrR family transcriptional regulator C-terminal domain-containing protein n=1 Tax=Actinoplanes sp. NPDC051494 TaxID=3363907 RepID=UPI0037A54924